ncbi:MAG: hypothetical protein OSB19_05440, partial [Opitutaceae bacterium]|nr:hypothetical protein [Opitutaceae bacterium]
RRDRTDDLLHAMQALFQLSYGPKTGDQNAIKENSWQANFSMNSESFSLHATEHNLAARRLTHVERS